MAEARRVVLEQRRAHGPTVSLAGARARVRGSRRLEQHVIDIAAKAAAKEEEAVGEAARIDGLAAAEVALDDSERLDREQRDAFELLTGVSGRAVPDRPSGGRLGADVAWAGGGLPGAEVAGDRVRDGRHNRLQICCFHVHQLTPRLSLALRKEASREARGPLPHWNEGSTGLLRRLCCCILADIRQFRFREPRGVPEPAHALRD